MTEPEPTAGDLPLPGGDFRLFITRLSFQGLLSLGLLENPITNSRQVNTEGARMILDDLMLLREKTEGNLEVDERSHLDKVIADLELAYTRLDAGGDQAVAANGE